MKKLFVLAITALMVLNLTAQEVRETTVSIGNLNVPAYTLTLQKDKKMVQKALDQRLKDAKLKTKKTDGFEASLGAVFYDIAPTAINFYTKVEGNSKSTTLTVAAISTDLSANQQTVNANVVAFLRGFDLYVAKREAAEQLEDAKDALKKAEKEQKNAAADLAKLEKATEKDRAKVTDLQKDIEKWQKNITKAEKDIKELNEKIEKATDGKLPDAQKRVQEAEKAVNEAKAVVEKYQRLAE